MADKCTPLGIVLVSSGSKGDLLLFRYPYKVETSNETAPNGNNLQLFSNNMTNSSNTVVIDQVLAPTTNVFCTGRCFTTYVI